jgi:hypothetical protein
MVKVLIRRKVFQKQRYRGQWITFFEGDNVRPVVTFTRHKKTFIGI